MAAVEPAASGVTPQVDEDFFAAVKARDIPVVADTLSRGANINGTDANRRTCLHLALLKTGVFNIDQLNGDQPLIDRSCRVPQEGLEKPSVVASLLHFEDSDQFRYTPLSLQLVEVLIGLGADVNAADSKGNTCLHYAVENRHCPELIPLLLNAGADFACLNNSHRCPLYHAVMANNIEAVRLLISRGADIRTIDIHESSMLYHAKSDAVLGLLLDAGASSLLNHVNAGKCTPFRIAISFCNIDTFRRMIEAGADINLKTEGIYGVNHWTPIHEAIIHRRIDFLKLLLEQGADPNTVDGKNKSVLDWAAQKRLSLASAVPEQSRGNDEALYFNFLEMLISHGADVKRSPNAFECVLERGTIDAICLFLERATVQELSHEGYPPLHSAVQNKRTEVFEYVLDLDIRRFDEKDVEGFTPLHRAISRCMLDHAEVLLDLGANMNNRNYCKKIAASARYCNSPKCIELLMSHGIFRVSLGNDSMIHLDDPQIFLGVPWSTPGRFERERMPKQTIMHVAAIESLGQPVHHLQIYEYIEVLNYFRNFYQSCKLELQILQETSIQNFTSINFYDILTEPNAYRYARNETMIRELGEQDLEQQFPIYGSWLRLRISQIQKRRQLFSDAAIALSRIFRFDPVTFEHITENILDKLSLMDWRMLARLGYQARFVNSPFHVNFHRSSRFMESLYNFMAHASFLCHGIIK